MTAKAPLPAPVIDTTLPYTTAWTDGSSTGRWGPGGWAWCVVDGPGAGRCDSGGHPDTTNQRMELQAAHEAVKALPGLLLVLSDSAYVVNCFRDRWWQKWRERSWHKVANVDLWRPFIDDVLARDGEVRFAWVKGHAGHPGNEEADRLAREARLALTPPEGVVVATSRTDSGPLPPETVTAVPVPVVRPPDRVCAVVDCGQPGRLYLCGPRCDDHSPAALAGRAVPVPDPRHTIDGLRTRQLPMPDQSRYGLARTDPPAYRVDGIQARPVPRPDESEAQR